MQSKLLIYFYFLILIRKVTFVDIDEDAILLLKQNLEFFDLSDRANIVKTDVFELDPSVFNKFKFDGDNNEEKNKDDDENIKPFDICLTNPPFGIQSIPYADSLFLDKASLITEESIFSMHKASTTEFLVKFLKERKFEVINKRNVLFDIPKTYKFHKDSSKNIEVVFLDALNEKYV